MNFLKLQTYWDNMVRSAKRIHKYSRKTREKSEFFKRIFLEFFVNIMCSAERSSAYCHYSLFFGRHHHSIFTPRDDIEYPKNTAKYPSLLPVLWRQKTWNNVIEILATWASRNSRNFGTFGTLGSPWTLCSSRTALELFHFDLRPG